MKKVNILRKYKLTSKAERIQRMQKYGSKKVETRYFDGVKAVIDEHNRQNDKIIVVSKNKIIREVHAVIFDEQQINLLHKFL